MQSRFLRILILSAFMVSLLASAGFAARRTSLAGNLLIKDRDDVFFMPQNIHDYTRMVTFDFGSSNAIGNGGIVFGNEQVTFGAFAHKTNFIGAIPNAFGSAGDGAPGGMNASGSNNFYDYLGSPFMAPMNWVDVVIGFGSEEMPWGIRASLGSAANKSEPSSGTGTTTDNNSLAFNIVGGTTINEDVEVSAEFTFGSGTNETTGGTSDSKQEISPIHFAASVRKTASEEGEALQLGYLGGFFFITGSNETTSGGSTGPKVDMTTFGFSGGVGPVYMPHERTTVAMYGTVEYFNHKDDTTPAGGGASTEVTQSSFTIPGMNIATEVELSSWFQARAGLRTRYMMNTMENKATTGSKDTSRSLEYNWYTGVGITMDNFMLDGYLDPSVLTSGTDLLGSSSDLFGAVSATFMF